MSTELPDWEVDAYVKADCGCGHGRMAHYSGEGPCFAMRQVVDYSVLPRPKWVEDKDWPFGRPINWPADLPMTEELCPCASFHDHAPSEPDFEVTNA
jgi:hypothetical protein